MIYTIVRKDYNDNVNAIISFDSISTVDESWSATVTSQTVEYGFNISDNITIEAPTYSITAVLSSYSLFNSDKEIVWGGEDFASVSNKTDSHIIARDEIIKIFKERSIITLVESSVNSNNPKLSEKYSELKSGYVREIDTCVITSLSIGHPDQGTGAFLISMVIQKVTLASIEVSELADGEKRALLKPLMKSYEESSSQTQTKKEEGTIDPETGLPDESVPEGTAGNREEMRKYYEELYGIKASEDYLDAVQRATHAMGVTGEPYSVIKKGNTYTVIKGFNANALVTVGGELIDNR